MRPSRSIEPFVTDFLRHLEVERRMSPNTLEAYRRDLDRLAAFLVARERAAADVDRADLDAFVRESMAEGRSPASTARLVACTRSFFKFLRMAGRLSHNPADESLNTKFCAPGGPIIELISYGVRAPGRTLRDGERAEPMAATTT